MIRPSAVPGSDERVTGLAAMENLLAESAGGALSWQGNPVETVTYLLDRTNDDLKIPTVNSHQTGADPGRSEGVRSPSSARDLKVSATGMERLYRRARERGVLFFKYDEAPVITAVDNTISVDLEDTTQFSAAERGHRSSLPSDLIVVPVPSPPTRRPGNSVGCCGFVRAPTAGLMDDNPQLQRVLTNRRGIFLGGRAASPRS